MLETDARCGVTRKVSFELLVTRREFSVLRLVTRDSPLATQIDCSRATATPLERRPSVLQRAVFDSDKGLEVSDQGDHSIH